MSLARKGNFMFEVIMGDILCADADYICHQVNCRNVMGAGVARTIYTKWPEVKSEYHRFCTLANSPYDLLGQVQIVPIQQAGISVINLFGQLNYGRKIGVIYTDYQAMKNALRKINQLCSGKSVAFPYGIGCGLAGGDWMTVEKMIIQCMWNCDVKLYMKE